MGTVVDGILGRRQGRHSKISDRSRLVFACTVNGTLEGWTINVWNRCEGVIRSKGNPTSAFCLTFILYLCTRRDSKALLRSADRNLANLNRFFSQFISLPFDDNATDANYFWLIELPVIALWSGY